MVDAKIMKLDKHECLCGFPMRTGTRIIGWLFFGGNIIWWLYCMYYMAIINPGASTYRYLLLTALIFIIAVPNILVLIGDFLGKRYLYFPFLSYHFLGVLLFLVHSILTTFVSVGALCIHKFSGQPEPHTFYNLMAHVNMYQVFHDLEFGIPYMCFFLAIDNFSSIVYAYSFTVVYRQYRLICHNNAPDSNIFYVNPAATFTSPPLTEKKSHENEEHYVDIDS